MVMKAPISVAEFSINHMGNLNACMKMIEKAKWAGADYVKLKKKDVQTFYTEDKLNSKYESPYGHTFGEYREMFEFSEEDFKRIDAKCKEVGIPWFSTVHDQKSLDLFVKEFNIPMLKVASTDVKKTDLFEMIKKETEVPLVFSTGGQDIEKIDQIVEMFSDRDVYIQQCTSTYPCPNNQLYLGNIVEMKERYKDLPNIHIGYSGHEEGIVPSILAVSMGAEIIERHFCLSRSSFVHHIECGVEPEEFKEMVDYFKDLPAMQESKFGMKESEVGFLLKAEYGTDFWDRNGEQLSAKKK